MRIVLASRSPQRREILERLGLEFEIEMPEVRERIDGPPGEVVLENALLKASAVARPGALVIGCDTDVVVDGQVIGKPSDEQQARASLELLSGRSHEVMSGLALVGPSSADRKAEVATSVVTFRELSADEVDRYLRSGEWRERAGAYAIQGLGSTLVERVEGDVSNVIGLPVALLLELAPELI